MKKRNWVAAAAALCALLCAPSFGRADQTTGLEAQYLCNGNTANSATSGAARDLTLDNAALGGQPITYVAAGAGPGGTNFGCIFNGTNRLRSPQDAFTADNNFTITFWIRNPSLVSQELLMQSMPGLTTSNSTNSVDFDNSTLRLWNTAASSFHAASSSVSGSAWHHVAITVSDGTLTGSKIYIDNVDRSGSPPSSAFTLQGTFYLGSRSDIDNPSTHFANFFNGELSDIRIYNRTLSAAEVGEVFGSPNVAQSSAGIPTLSEWGMIILFAALAGSMLFSMRRKKQAAQQA